MPEQALHAPLGLLKLKFLGSISSRLILQSGQEKFSENFNSVLLSIAITVSPFDSFREVSTEFVRLSLSID